MRVTTTCLALCSLALPFVAQAAPDQAEAASAHAAPDDSAGQDPAGQGNDRGDAITRSIAAARPGEIIVIPHLPQGYLLSTGSFAGGNYPSASWSWPDRTDAYPAPGIIVLGNNRFAGAAIGDPETCTRKLTSPYTQTCLNATDYRVIMDPASIPAGPRTTNVGMTIGCLPNHRNPDPTNRTRQGYWRNWIACVYQEVDTGQDGQPNTQGHGFGSDISTEFLNGTLSVGSNHGIFREVDVNVYGTVQDGGITRADFILSSCGPYEQGTFSGVNACQASVLAGKSPWGITTEFANAVEIGATPFAASAAPSPQSNGHGETVYRRTVDHYMVYPRWTNGILAQGAVNNFVAQEAVAGESGFAFLALAADGTNRFTVDKTAGNIASNGSITAGSRISARGAIEVDGQAGSQRAIGIATSGTSRWQIKGTATPEAAGDVGTDLAIARLHNDGSAAGTPLSISRATGVVRIENALRLPAYTVNTLPHCTDEYSGVLAAVSDAQIVNYNVTPIGHGTHAVPVFCDGKTWTMH